MNVADDVSKWRHVPYFKRNVALLKNFSCGYRLISKELWPLRHPVLTSPSFHVLELIKRRAVYRNSPSHWRT